MNALYIIFIVLSAIIAVAVLAYVGVDVYREKKDADKQSKND